MAIVIAMQAVINIVVIAIQAIIHIVVVLLVVVVVGRTAMRQLFNHRPFIICGAGHAQSTGARKKEQFC